MASDIGLRAGELLPQMEFTDSSESFLNRLADEPSLRFQVRDALGTFSIEPERSLDLGYTSGPYAKVRDLFACLGFDANDYTRGQLQAITDSFMKGCFELRDDFSHFLSGEHTTEPRLVTLAQLPPELQFLAAFKVIERVNPSLHLAYTKGLEQFEAYLRDRLGLTVPVANDVITAASIINAPTIIGDSLSYPPGLMEWGGYSIESSKVERALLVGPVGPKYGKHLGVDLMAGVSKALDFKFRDVYDDPKYLSGIVLPHRDGSYRSWAEAIDAFWPEVNRITDSALRLTDKPESEFPMWRSYLFMNTVYGRVFARPIVSGFDGSIDQLAAWTEPVPDKEYPARLKDAMAWIKAIEIDGNMDKRGIDLAHQALAISIVEEVERRIILGGDTETKGRISAATSLIGYMSESSPDLVDQLLEFSPILGPFLLRESERRASPWGHKFQA